MYPYTIIMNNNKYLQRRQYLTAVFEDTMLILNSDMNPEQENILKSIKNQIFISHNQSIILPKPTKKQKLEVHVSGMRTMEAAQQYVQKEKHVAVLNFASATQPGGGVRNGSSAQEECLCRVSTLLPCLESEMPHKMFYGPHRKSSSPLHNDDLIYTRDVIVFKDDEYKLLDKMFRVDVITCAAPNLRENPSNAYNPNEGQPVKINPNELMNIHISRARKILAAAALNQAEVVILGAFGCGAFRNPPEIVATAYQKVLEEFHGYFDCIEFAVYCRPGDSRNYDAFKSVLG